MPVPDEDRAEFMALVVLPLERPRALLAQVQALQGRREDPPAQLALAVVAALLGSVDRKTSPLYERHIQAAARFALARADAEPGAWARVLGVAQAVAHTTQRPELAHAAPGAPEPP